MVLPFYEVFLQCDMELIPSLGFFGPTYHLNLRIGHRYQLGLGRQLVLDIALWLKVDHCIL